MKIMSRTILLILFLVTGLLSITSFAQADFSSNDVQLINRTADSNSYLNTTSNETFVELFPREVNMNNLSGVYEPYEEVTNFTANAYNMSLRWNNNSVIFKFYTVNQSGYKQYFTNKTQQQLDDLGLVTTTRSGYGMYIYTHNMTTNVSKQPTIFGYDIESVNVTCDRRYKEFVCGDQAISFADAINIQNLTVNITNQSIEFSGADLKYIDPQIVLDRFSVWNSWGVDYDDCANLYDSIQESGGNNQVREGYITFSAGCTGHYGIYRTYFAFNTNSLGGNWNYNSVQFKWNPDYVSDAIGDSDDIQFRRVIASDANSWTPSPGAESQAVYNAIGAREVYATNTAPVQDQYNIENLLGSGTNAVTQLKNDVQNGRRFFIGIRQPVETSVDEGYIDIWNEDDTRGPSLIITYTVPDQTPPVTTASATSPPGGSSYTFGTTTSSNVQVTLSCSDSGGDPVSGCDVTKYCVDTNNTCTPISSYTSPFVVSTEGTSYLRYFSRDVAGNLEGLNTRSIIIDKNFPDNVALYVHNLKIWEYLGELSTTQTTTDFVNELNGELDNCTADALGYCVIPLVVHSDHIGNTNISNINLRFNVGDYLWNSSGLANLQTYRLRIQANDGFFNSGQDASDADFTLGADLTSPTISFVSPTPSNGSSQSSANFIINVTGIELNLRTVLVELNSTNYTMSCVGTSPYYCNYTFTGLGSGTYTIRAFANDTQGNNNRTEIRTFTIDNGVPLISIVAPQNISYATLQTALNYTVFDTNLQACKYSTNGGSTNTSVTCGNNLTGLTSSQGTDTWTVYVNDTVGNTNSSSVTFFVDSLAPTIQYVSPTEADVSTITRRNILINVTATDTNLANITINLYNSTGLYNRTVLTSSPAFVNISVNADGNYTFNATARDLLSNLNITTTRTVIVNTQQVSSLINFTSFTPTHGSSQNASSFSAGLTTSYNGTYYDFVDLDNKLSLWIRGDDRNATGSLVDISGYNNTVTTVGSVQNTTGAFGTALSFVNANSAGVRVANSQSLNVTDAFTISFWMKGSDVRYNQFLLGKWDGTAGQIAWQVSLATGGICDGLDVYVSQDGGSVNRAYTRKCNQNYQDGNWHNIVGVFNPGQELSLYVDGVSSGFTTVGNIATLTNVYSNTHSLYIGNRSTGAYNGSIDEILFFKRALTQSEVNSLYNAQSNQYVNTFISLLAGSHTIKGLAVNTSGNLTSTETRTISITAPYPSLQFISPTPASGSTINLSQFVANLSSSDSGTHYAVTDFDRDIVLWMPFDDINASGSPLDISTYGSHGSTQGNATQSVSGKFGKSFTFDGVGDSVTVPDQDSLDLNSSFSVSFWFKGNASTAQQPFVGKWNGTTNQIAWFTDLATGGVCDGIDFYVSKDGGSTDRVYVRECNKRYQDNQWHLFTGTFDAGNSIKMYIDGASVGSTQGTISTVTGVYTNNQSLQIGAGYTTAQYNGSIDDVLVFRRALSQQEVSALYNASSNQYSNNFSQIDDITHALRGYAMNNYGVRNSTILQTVRVILPLDVYGLSYFTLNSTQHGVAFWINNTISANITNVAWNVTTGISTISSLPSLNMTIKPSDPKLVLIYYNYNASGTYPITATAYSANYKDTEGISVTI